jgi:malonyl-CoA/methylmalonyl-CoA synthetase
MMHEANLLAGALRAPSIGRDDDIFAVRAGGEPSLTHGALWANAARAAGALIAAGVAPGDRVAVQVEKSLEALELYLGTVLAGAVYLPLNTGYTSGEVAYFLTNAEPRVFVCDPGAAAALAPVAAAAGVGALLTLDIAGAGTLTEAMAAAAPLDEGIARAAGDLAAILYTSGTTGRSKGAMLTHDNLLSNAQVLAQAWRFTSDDVLIHALPIFHTHGLFVATNVALISGASLIYHAKFDAEAILADMARATSLMGVPTFYTRLLSLPGLTREAAKGMRLFISGSAPLLADTHAQWTARTGKPILERYGMTETCMNTSNPYAGERRAGTVGFALPGVELRIMADGAEAPQGEIGGIEVRGSNVFAGYWRMPEKTAEELRPDGWFITGDVGVIDADGYVAIVGRSKDLIISGGFNIYPKEIEGLIDAVDGVLETAVFAMPHPDFGETVGVAVVRAPGSSITAEQLKAAVAPDLARFKHPRHIVFLDALPRNTMGKVQKAQLRETYRDVFMAGAKS